MTFSNTANLIQRKKVATIIRWEDAVSMLDQWEFFLELILGLAGGQLAVYKLLILIESAGEFSARLMEQDFHQPTIPEELVRHIQTEFNKIFRQVFTSAFPKMWTQLSTLRHTLNTRHFRPYYVVILGGFQDNQRTIDGTDGEKSNIDTTRKWRQRNSHLTENGKDGQSRGHLQTVTNIVPTICNGIQAPACHGNERGDDRYRPPPLTNAGQPFL